MNLVYGKEKILFTVALLISIIVWLAIIGGTFGIALVYILAFYILYLFAQSAFISYLKGTGVKITASQFPDLHKSIIDSAQKLGIKEVPEAYLIHADGAFNALATHFRGKNFIVLFSDVADALKDNPDAINFYIGHELGHLKQKHLIWGPVLAPALLLPILGAAYSRAREYTCDRHGLAACAQPESAEQGLAALAAGGKRWKEMDKTGYAAQSSVSGGFWMSLHELVSDYPWLTKRMASLQALSKTQEPAFPRRNAFAWVLALFVPRLGVGGSAASMLVFVAIIGILAAIAIPAYQGYVDKAAVAEAYNLSQPYRQGVLDYATEKNVWPSNNSHIGLAADGKQQSKRIGEIKLGHSGVISVLFSSGKFDGKKLKLEPLVVDGDLKWRCVSDTISANLMPADCRRGIRGNKTQR